MMHLLDLQIGDFVVVELAQVHMVIMIDFFMRADVAYIAEGSGLSDTPFFFPDPAPNAITKTLLCGPAHTFERDVDLSQIRFVGPTICIEDSDAVRHFHRSEIFE